MTHGLLPDRQGRSDTSRRPLLFAALLVTALAGCATPEGLQVAVIDAASEGFVVYGPVDWEPVVSVVLHPPNPQGGGWARADRPHPSGDQWSVRWNHSSVDYEQGGPVPHRAIMRLTGLHAPRSEQVLSLRFQLSGRETPDGREYLDMPVERGEVVVLDLDEAGGITRREPRAQ